MPHEVYGNIEENKLGDVLLEEFEIGITAKVRNIVDRAGHEIVDSDHPVSPGKEQIRQMRAEEPRGASNDAARLCCLCGAFRHLGFQLQLAPAPVKTTGKVRKIIFTSSHS